MTHRVTDTDFIQKMDSILLQYSETIELLVAIPANPVLPSSVSHWTPPSSTARYFHMQTRLQAAQILLLQGHKSHGAFMLPCSGQNFSRYLHQQVLDANTYSADTNMMSKLCPPLVSQQSADTTEVQLFSIKVFCEKNDWLVFDRNLVWKWVKPQSMYKTSGFWETTLERVVVDAEWSAGTGISIVVKSVDGKEFGEIEEGRVK